MNMRPLFCAALPTPAPSPIAIVATAGSAWTIAADLLLQPIHFRERNVLAGLGRAEQNAGVLLREEALGDDDEQIAGRDDRRDEGQQASRTVPQHEIEAALIAVRHRVETLSR